MKLVQNKDGSWPFSFNAVDRNEIHDGSKFGSQASWMVLGIIHYTYATGDEQYLRMAARAMNFVLTLQDPSDGAIKGHPEVIWKSVEHNLDAYAAFTHLAAILNNSNLFTGRRVPYSRAARKIRKFLETEAWDNNEGRFLRGKNDSYEVLDTNTWQQLWMNIKCYNKTI